MRNKLLLLFTFAFLIRLIALNQSLWLDEATTAKVVTTYNSLQIITTFAPFDFHPPLYYLFMKLWAMLFGTSEIALRMPSVLFSLLTGFIIYRILQKKHGTIAWWATVFFLFNPLIIYYSQEARMYSMATFLLTLTVFFVLQTKPKSIAFAGVCAGCAFLTFYGSSLFIAPIALWLFIRKQWKSLVFFSIPLALLCGLVAPLLFTQLSHSSVSVASVPGWRAVLGSPSIKQLALIPLKFAGGRISFDPKVLYYLMVGGWTMFVFTGVYKGSRKYPFFVSYLLVPIILGLLLSFFTPLLQYFRFLPAILSVVILLAFGYTNRWARYMLLTGFVCWSTLYLLFPAFHREDWKQATTHIKKMSTVAMIAPSSDPVRYYLPDISIHELRNVDELFMRPTIAVIPYTAEMYGIDYARTMKQGGYRMATQWHERGVTVEMWEKVVGYAHR